MARSEQELITFLDELGIAHETVRHPPLFTVEQSQALRGQIPGSHTKNLFLKDKKGQYFLLTLAEDAQVDLKSLHQLIGASGRVSFGKPEALMHLLGVAPGAVTALGLINDTEGAVTMLFDADLMEHETINCHPLTNEATTSLSREDLLRFVNATGHKPHILKVTGQSPH
ncbi:prolyl-tRNA synthetase associated domain-containing protein [Mesorhizobium xinjiangense]|uniref:prolyl-tRNA synthetase associated domain-containing protein n=1 Tax=Mesorhizobium xinjiangense TaxID=2678685 RepID=UPI0012EEA47C|nr:prolyl-tRNA synthetase associated domain-containing protein [Mesorhizobium xinjiangense]